MSQRMQRVFLGMFALAGLGLLILGIILYINQIIFIKSAVETTATITFVIPWEGPTDDGSRNNDVYVVFFVDGKEYGGKLPGGVSDPQEGQKVKIYYNPDNPFDFQNDGSLAMFMAMGGGLLCFILCGKTWAHELKSKRVKLPSDTLSIYDDNYEKVDFDEGGL